jgi:hypothetical protein
VLGALGERGGVPGAERILAAWYADQPLPKHGGERISQAVEQAINSPLLIHGEGKPKHQGNNVTLSNIRGNDTTYTLRRLARDAPEILSKVQSGKIEPPSEVVLCDDRPKLKDLLVKHRPKGKRGGDRRSESFKIDNVNFEKPKTGNSRLYIEERLQRPRSSVHQQTSPNRSSKQFEVPSQERKSERLWRCVTLAGRKKRMEMLEIPTIPLATQMSIFFVA